MGNAQEKTDNFEHDVPAELEKVVIEPTGPHESTVVLLHGTSQTGATFSAPFLSFEFPSLWSLATAGGSTTLPALFPNTRWVFPTGTKRNTTVFDGKETNAWFDIHNFSDRTQGENDQIPGLRSSILSLTSLIRDELSLLPSSLPSSPDQDARKEGKLILGGFSQGCAMIATLLLSQELNSLPSNRDGQEDGGAIAGFVGMSGWLPFRAQIQAVCSEASGPHEANEAAAAYVRDLLSLPALPDGEDGERRSGQGKVWIGHGADDVKVLPQWVGEMVGVLRMTGKEVEVKTYEGLAHWWNAEEMSGLAGQVRRMIE
ncbi:Alpha/Beta hydrolase protein [Bisporella sp. PMI_857]|nr:Alpha/Beta hydrolase protein [Bisporella sp. PMI_857]